MSTQSHNRRIGDIFIVTAISMAYVAVCHFGGAKVEESKIIPKKKYEEIARRYVPIAENCVKMENYGIGGVTETVRQDMCINAQNPSGSLPLQEIRDYNEYIHPWSGTGRWAKNFIACGMGGVAGVLGAIGVGFRRG
jgi:hypothetical protein